jgi:hypothetical protein
MKRFLLWAVAVAVICSTAAFGQTQITLGGSTNNVQFAGLGAGNPNQVAVTFLGTCGKTGGVTNTCVSGTAAGTGALLSGPAPWEIIDVKHAVKITMTFVGAGSWSVSQTGNLLFEYGTGGSLLSGNLQLLTFSQLAGDNLGNFNTQATVNLTNLSGSLAPIFSPLGGKLNFAVLFKQGTPNVATLLGTTNIIKAKVDHGAVHPTPEPSSIALFGSGLVAVGGFLRRRILQA